MIDSVKSGRQIQQNEDIFFYVEEILAYHSKASFVQTQQKQNKTSRFVFPQFQQASTIVLVEINHKLRAGAPRAAGERARNSRVSNTALRLEIITFVAKLAVSLHTKNHVHYVIKT